MKRSNSVELRQTKETIQAQAAMILEQAESLKANAGRKPETVLPLLCGKLGPELGHLDLLEAMFGLCHELRNQAPFYDVIISDEASGRMPSLLVKTILDRIRAELGLPKTKIIFLIGGHCSTEQSLQVDRFLSQNRQRLENSLVVTEYLESGDSMTDFLRLFADNGLYPDVASVSVCDERSRYDFGRDLFVGADRCDAGLGLYGYSGREACGVTKKDRDVPSAHPQRWKDCIRRGRVNAQRSINRSRREIALIAAVFYQLIEPEILNLQERLR